MWGDFIVIFFKFLLESIFKIIVVFIVEIFGGKNDLNLKYVLFFMCYKRIK